MPTPTRLIVDTAEPMESTPSEQIMVNDREERELYSEAGEETQAITQAPFFACRSHKSRQVNFNDQVAINLPPEAVSLIRSALLAYRATQTTLQPSNAPF